MLVGAQSNDMYQRALASHLAHGEKWGYRSEILRRSILGQVGEWRDMAFTKMTHIMGLIISEMTKPEEERAKWVV